jgi:hypothetical protein
MSRILDYIAKYDETLTIAQLKNAIKEKEKVKEQEELDEIEAVKSQFQNTFLKEIDTDTIFGRTLNLYNLKTFVRTERNTDWDFIYYFEGSQISFSERGINRSVFNPERCSDSFDRRYLESLEIITEDDFNSYKSQYNEISDRLNDLIK